MPTPRRRGAAALAAALALAGLTTTAAARSELPITQTVLPDGAIRYSVPITVGDGPPIEAMLDTGSFGIRVLKSALAPGQYADAGRHVSYNFGGGIKLDGVPKRARPNTMILNSLLDTDLYKFTMMQVVLHQFPGAQVEYRFKCRTEGVDLRPYVREIRDQIHQLCTLRFRGDELAYLRSLRFIKSDFVDFLGIFHLNAKYIDVRPAASDDGQIEITVKGPWLHTIPFEIPVLALVNEIYFRHTQRTPDYAEGVRRLDSKISLIRDDARLADMRIAPSGCLSAGRALGDRRSGKFRGRRRHGGRITLQHRRGDVEADDGREHQRHHQRDHERGGVIGRGPLGTASRTLGKDGWDVHGSPRVRPAARAGRGRADRTIRRGSRGQPQAAWSIGYCRRA